MALTPPYSFPSCRPLTVLTAARRMPPALLLMFTFVLGAGRILIEPAY